MPSLPQLLFLPLELVMRGLCCWVLADAAVVIVRCVVDTGVFSDASTAFNVGRTFAAIGVFWLSTLFPPSLLVDSPEETRVYLETRDEKRRLREEKTRDHLTMMDNYDNILQLTKRDHDILKQLIATGMATREMIHDEVTSIRFSLALTRIFLKIFGAKRDEMDRCKELIPTMEELVVVCEKILELCRPMDAA